MHEIEAEAAGGGSSGGRVKRARVVGGGGPGRRRRLHIDIPDNVRTAFESNRTSEIQVRTKQNEVQQREAEADAIRKLNEALAQAGENYVLLRAIESGKVDFWVLPQGNNFTLQTPSRPSP